MIRRHMFVWALAAFVAMNTTGRADGISIKGPRAAFGFDEGSGPATSDTSGHANTGSLAGAAWTASGRYGHGLFFDGQSRVSVAESYLLDLRNRLTLEAWVFPTSSSAWQPVVMKERAGGAAYALYASDTAGRPAVSVRIGRADRSVAGPVSLPLSTWTHLAATFDGTTLKLYVNGVEAGRRALRGSIVASDRPLQIGGSPLSGRFFMGNLDEVRIYDRALTGPEIQADEKTPVSVPQVPGQGFSLSAAPGSLTIPQGGNATYAVSVGAAKGFTGPVSLSASGLPPGTTASFAPTAVTGSGSATLTVTTAANTPAGLSTLTITGTGGAMTQSAAVNLAVTQTSHPTLVVLSPNGPSQVWTAGQPATITWSSNLGDADAVTIELSRDGGLTYPILIASGMPSNGSETILVPAGWETPGARISVTSMSNPSVFDMSDADFAIQSATLAQITFQPSSEIFPNPDRGFFSWTDFSYPDYSYVRALGNSLTRPYFRLDAYRNTPLPQSFLDDLTESFRKARQAGIKIIPRFSYNFGPYPDSDPDASLPQILAHLRQLAPVLSANVDVISSVEAGFIGAWGEWHTSTNGLDTDPVAKAAVLSALMAAVPASRMIAVRYPSDMQLLNGPPIDTNEAFSGTNRARVGSHQDCFLASADDEGTWGRTGNAYEYDKAYVALNGLFAVVGGETCNVDPPRSDCPTALAELEYLHWSYLNEDYEPSVIQGFKDGGCFSEIERRLGYRYALSSASYSAAVAPGGNFQLNLQLTNEGFAAMFNARPVFAVLYRGAEKFVCQLHTDPRRWAAGTVTTVSDTCSLPATLTSGTYQLALWLPDESPSIRDNPSYAVQFANLGVWDAARGFNVIASDVVIR